MKVTLTRQLRPSVHPSLSADHSRRQGQAGRRGTSGSLPTAPAGFVPPCSPALAARSGSKTFPANPEIPRRAPSPSNSPRRSRLCGRSSTANFVICLFFFFFHGLFHLIPPPAPARSLSIPPCPRPAPARCSAAGHGSLDPLWQKGGPKKSNGSFSGFLSCFWGQLRNNFYSASLLRGDFIHAGFYSEHRGDAEE